MVHRVVPPHALPLLLCVVCGGGEGMCRASGARPVSHVMLRPLECRVGAGEARGRRKLLALLCRTRNGSSCRERAEMMTWSCRGDSGGPNAVFRASLAAPVLELSDEVVGASSKLSARLPALPVESEGRGAGLQTRLDVL